MYYAILYYFKLFSKEKISKITYNSYKNNSNNNLT